MEVEELKKLLLASDEEKQKLKERIQKGEQRESKAEKGDKWKYSQRTDKSQTTKGDPSNANGKLRPDYLQPWEDFIDNQKAKLETLYSVYSASNDMPRVFDSRHFIKKLGEEVASRKLASEQDLQNFQYNIVERPVTKIVEHLKSQDGLCKPLNLAGGIQFYNHMSPLSDNNEEVAQSLSEQQVGWHTPRPQPDSICVFTTIKDRTQIAMVAEYKAGHKLTLVHLRLVLGSDRPWLDLDSIINRAQVPSLKDTIAHFKFNAERLVAAAVIQAFHYMVQCGTQYGYITTREAYVFLYIKPDENAKTVYYHLAEPKEDINAQKKAYPNTEDYLHRTAEKERCLLGAGTMT